MERNPKAVAEHRDEHPESYQAPRVESVVSSADIEREALYGGFISVT